MLCEGFASDMVRNIDKLLPLVSSIIFIVYLVDVNGFILRLPCERAANFSIIQQDAVLQGSVIATFMFIELSECQSRCIFEDGCQSINYQEHGDRICELNNVTTEDFRYQVRLTPKIGWKYMSSDHRHTIVGYNCNLYNPCAPGILCTDTCEVPGYKCHACAADQLGLNCQTAWKDCQDVMNAGHRKNGVYIINPELKRGKHFSVYCKFQPEMGIAWTVIQRRIDELNFNRSWTEYENGFGFFNGSFWLGLKNMHALTSGRGMKPRLHIGITSNLGNQRANGFAEYGEFSVGNSSDKYILHVANFESSSTVGDSLMGDAYSINQMKFTTFDQDNDNALMENCAMSYLGGWWFSKCFSAFLNGIYPPKDLVVSDCSDYKTYAKYLTWKSFKDCYGDIIFSEMQIRNG